MSAERIEGAEWDEVPLLDLEPADLWWERDEWGWPRQPTRLPEVAFAVDCRTQPRRKGTPHVVTLNDGWQLETGHDLDVERVAVALGSYSTCVQLADQLLPAARDVWLHRQRLVPPAIVRRGSGWVPAEPVEGCSCRVWAPGTAAQAAEHLRGIAHWAAVHDAKRTALQSVCEQISPLLEEHCRPPSWRDRHHAGLRLTESFAVDELWESGISPEVIVAVTDRLAPGGEPMDARIVREVALHRIDAGWLSHFQASGPALLNWALMTFCQRDVDDPACRLDWLALGLHPFDVTVLMDSGWRPAEIQAVAAQVSVNTRRAGEAAAAWWRLEVKPETYDLTLLLGCGAPTIPKFGRDQVIRLLSMVAHLPDPPEFDDAALILQASGTVTTAHTLISFGVRDLAAALELL